MNKINQLTNQYELQKTLRFSLLPVGETDTFLAERLLVQNDEIKAENAAKVKGYMDRYHKVFIESVLSDMRLTDLDKYARLYFENSKEDDAKEEMASVIEALHKQISDAFQTHQLYKEMFGKEMITKILPEFLTDEEEKAIVASFKSFTVFFYDFYNVRKNIYSKEAPANSIPYRCIDENLPKFLENAKFFAQIRMSLPEENLKMLDGEMRGLVGCSLENVFEVEYFNKTLCQSGIEKYNTVIGGYSTEDGCKVKGINEYINIYNQTEAKDGNKLPFLKPLYKQILSEREIISFVAEMFSSDQDVLSAINEFYSPSDAETLSMSSVLDRAGKLFSNIRRYNPDEIFVADRYVPDISNSVFGSWNAIQSAWNKEYDESSDTKRKDTKAYIDQRKREYKNINSFSIEQLQALGDKDGITGKTIVGYLGNGATSAVYEIKSAYDTLESLLSGERTLSKKLMSDDKTIGQIKALLDAIKTLERLIKPFLGTGKEDNRNVEFYNEITPLVDKLASVDRLYDRVRNYVTQKPYSKEKIKLTFNVGDFFSGWAQDFSSKGAHILRREDEYFLMIVDKTLSKEDVAAISSGYEDQNAIRYGYHFIKPDMKTVPRMFIRSMKDRFAPAIEKYDLPVHDILDLYDKGLFKTEYAKKDPEGQKAALKKLIDYYKLGFERHDSYKGFTFNWKPSEEYNNIAEFYRDAERTCYKLTEEGINFDAVMGLVNEGKVYLFRFNNKDFSAHSKGMPNMHTLFFKALFAKENLDAPMFKINGGAEMFYRSASIGKEEQIIHPALYPLSNKTPDNKKKKSVFAYDIVKDRRYTQNQYFVHIPITLNFGADGAEMEINKKVRSIIKNADETYVIGINRGERHLIYATVIDGHGRIVEQLSFNIVGGVNYHNLLDRKEKERQQARQDWTSINSIKNIKEGYVSHVVHEICKLVTKYDAVIAMEDLNVSFKNSRAKIEKQVYQKFEKMLIDKLNFLAFKGRDNNEPGGLLKAYQLTSKFKSFSEMRGQNGVVFFIPTWSIGKTDPVTGFVDLFRLRYTNVKDAKDFFAKFNEIRYNKSENLFKFSFNYSSFSLSIADYTDSWAVYTNGDRVSNYRDTKTGEWTSELVNLTDAFKKLFRDFGIDYTTNLQAAIYEQTEKEFFERLVTLFSLTVQIRNSYIGEVDADFVISPCKNAAGKFFDSRDYKDAPSATLPASADANDAYNVARKGLWAVNVLKYTPDELLPKVRLSISNKDWLCFAQGGAGF